MFLGPRRRDRASGMGERRSLFFVPGGGEAGFKGLRVKRGEDHRAALCHFLETVAQPVPSGKREWQKGKGMGDPGPKEGVRGRGRESVKEKCVVPVALAALQGQGHLLLRDRWALPGSEG